MKKILVIQTASLGDAILATALLEKLHIAFPDSHLDFMVKKGTESLFDGHPFLNRILVWDKSSKLSDFIRLLKEVRHQRYSLVVNVQRFALTGLLTILSGATTTTGFNKNPFSQLFSRRVMHRISGGIHEVDRNQLLIAGLTDNIPARPKLYPKQIPDPGILGRDIPAQSTGPGSPHVPSGIYYTVSPASLWFTKQFPAARWAELIRMMPPEATVYLLGSDIDFDLCEEIRSLGQGHETRDREIRNLAGRIGLLESAALMQGARMNFTNDSAPMHMASAVNAPVTAIYCSTVPEFGFGPLSDDSSVIEVKEKLTCRPCGLHGRDHCPESHFRCAYGIDLSADSTRL